MRHLDYVSDMSSEFRYNNIMYVLAAYVVTFLEGGRSFEDLAREIIFTPLGMNYSTFVQEASDRWDSEFATPYNDFEGSLRNMSMESVA